MRTGGHFLADGRGISSKVVDELTQNAFKFSDPGTAVRLMLSEAFNTIALSISDQGRGFSTEQITRVGAYMQFDRTMQEQQGLGLAWSSPNGSSLARARFPLLSSRTRALSSRPNSPRQQPDRGMKFQNGSRP